MKTETKLRFWTWLRDLCHRHMEALTKHTRCCPHCGRWTHEMGGMLYVNLNANYQHMLCRQCWRGSTWDMRGMLPYPVELGTSLEGMGPNVGKAYESE